MAYIDNTDTKKEMNDAMRGNAVSNIAPTKINDSVQPVININPKDYRRCNIIKRASALNSTSATIYTTPTDKDFYLVGATLSLIKDATSTSTYSALDVTINGARGEIIYIPTITLTAETQSLSISLPFPILVDRNTTIRVLNGTNVANITSSGTIVGYTVEP